MGTKFPVNSPFASRSLTAGAVFGTTTSRWRPPLSSPTGSAVTSRHCGVGGRHAQQVASLGQPPSMFAVFEDCRCDLHTMSSLSSLVSETSATSGQKLTTDLTSPSKYSTSKSGRSIISSAIPTGAPFRNAYIFCERGGWRCRDLGR